jgi:hypothetical protein
VNFRREPIRSRKLLDSARGAQCTMQVPGVCNHDPSTVVSAHIHDETFGFGEKADDSSTVFACHACHAWLDQGLWLGKMSEAEVLRIVLRAMQRTMRARILGDVMKVELDKPKPFAERKTKPRKPTDLRAKVSPGRPLQSASNWPPKGSRKIPSRAKP